MLLFKASGGNEIPFNSIKKFTTKIKLNFCMYVLNQP